MRALLVMLFLSLLPHRLGAWFSPHTIKSDEEVLFFPGEIYPTGEGDTWRMEVHGWIYEPELFGEVKGLFRESLDADEAPANDDSIFDRRAHWFLVDNERGKRIRVRLDGQVFENAEVFEMEKSGANGHFHGIVELSEARVRRLQGSGDVIGFEAVTRKKDTREFKGRALVMEAEGVSVISDIDDTLKISEVHDKKALLRNTFYKPFEAAPGMSAFYRDLRERQQARFHYVSASPWQLYPPLQAFMDTEGFPRGSFHLKYFRWKDKNFFNLFQDPIVYKRGLIEGLLAKYPRRAFVLIGDSGEKDPEVYGEIARAHPGRIRHILIRDVGVQGDETARYEAAFGGLAAETWQVFSDPGLIALPEAP